MAENRDEILANFQACTGIDDVAESIVHLEETNWDLLKAINRAIPQDMSNVTTESSPDVEMIEEVKGSRPIMRSLMNSHRPTAEDEDDDIMICNDSPETYPYSFKRNINDMMTGPSTSNAKEKSRLLKIIVEFKGQDILIELTERDTVADLKRRLQSITSIPLCKQQLSGWKTNPRSDTFSLSTLNLASETRLRLSSIDSRDGFMNDDVIDKLTLKYTLNIKNETQNKEHSLPYPGTKAISEIKTDVYTITNIPVRHQVWSGWPESLKDDSTMLGCSGVNHPVHSLTLKSSDTNEDKKKYKGVINLDDSEDSSPEEFEDATESFTGDEDIFVSETRPRARLQPLIPDMCEDETAGCLHFSEEFANRYGALHPDFFPGTLEDAIKEACMKPARERRLLAVYLHHDGSVLSNVFCTQLLCCESVIQCLNANFVVWGWDLTFEYNNLKFLASVKRTLGQIAEHQLRNIPQERLPSIIIINRVRSLTEITAVIHGNVGVSELMGSLTEAVDVFMMQQKIEIREEDERTAREMIMFEQDAAYRESLEIDRAKEEARKQQELIETQKKEKVEMEKQQEEAKKEAIRLEVKSRLPQEPDDGCGDITKIKVRVPKGDVIERRFNSSEPLQNLLDFLIVEGYPYSDYKVISSWPRRDLTSVDPTQSFKELKLYPQETVILEER